jgi:queuine tRNA-ribosyltransferase
MPNYIDLFLPARAVISDALRGRANGVYWTAEEVAHVDDAFFEEVQQYIGLQTYVLGDVLPDEISLLVKMGIDYYESDKPALHAQNGLIYHAEGVFSIEEPLNSEAFDLLDSACLCPTCQSGYTRAYLHHLYMHVPLLCHRLLIQHNVYFSNLN